MQEPIKYTDLASKAGISLAYAHEILSTSRAPSRKMAFHIWRTTGQKFGPLVGLSDDDIATLERIESQAAA